jgi:hypothetical protein
MFSDSEIKFLMNGHSESATLNRELKPIRNLRDLGCPSRIFEKILEHRAKKLGRTFLEFRSANAAPAQASRSNNLQDQLDAIALF